ncbi:MAG: lactonase family protein [Chloroflexi bacterium]|nr:lactonase family protein [Chloroflexota bacterium]
MLVFVGTYTTTTSEGIYVLRMDESTGELSHVSHIGGVTNPSFVALNPAGAVLYAVSELASEDGASAGSVIAYSIDRDAGRLTPINSQSTGGPGPCHLQVDATSSYVCVANYDGGSVAMLPLNEDGSLEPASHFIQHEGSSVNERRQERAHAHSFNIDPTNTFGFVPDLGQDKIVTYRLDFENGKLLPGDPPFTTSSAPGAGPRHFDYHPNGELVFVINELGNTITSYRYDSSAGTLAEIETVPTLPDGWSGSNSTADVHVSSDGRFVYGSNRGHDSLVIYEVDQATGGMSYVGHESTRGETPRNFGIDPSGQFLLAANQGTDNIVSFKRDQSTGKLEATGAEIEVPMPVCLKFLAG